MKDNKRIHIKHESQLKFILDGCRVYMPQRDTTRDWPDPSDYWPDAGEFEREYWYAQKDIRWEDGATLTSSVLKSGGFYVEKSFYNEEKTMSENKPIDLKCKSCDANIFHLREKPFVNGTMHVEAVCAACNKHFQYVSQALREFADDAKPLEELRMPFGKHKGVLLSECPRDYLQWASDNLTSGFVIKIKEFLAKYP